VIEAIRFKVDLPNYGVFDEKRDVRAGPGAGPDLFNGVRIGIPICEDIWGAEVVECLSETGGEILLVPNGSPYWRGKTEYRLNIAMARVVESGLPLIYLNMLGGQDELVFDGASFVLNADRSVGAQLPTLREAVALTEWRREAGGWRCIGGPMAKADEGDKTDYGACVLGLRDYVDKSGFKGVVLGLSGGIDSHCAPRWRWMRSARPRALRDAAVSVHLADSLNDAAKCAKALGVHTTSCLSNRRFSDWRRRSSPPSPGRSATSPRRTSRHAPAADPDGDLQQVWADGGDDRQQIRNVGRLRDALWRHERRLQSGQGPVQDRGVSAVAAAQRVEARGALGPDGEVIPENIIVKPPTAELRENQKDQDSLPPYDMLDQILERLVEREEPIATIVASGLTATSRSRSGACSISPNTSGDRRRRGQGDAAEFRPRPPLSDRQSLPRQRRAAGAGPRPAQGRRVEQDRSLRFLGQGVFRLTGQSLAISAPAGMSVRPRGPCDWDRAWMAPRQVPDLQSMPRSRP
jgi:NAD+ synthase